MACSLGPAGDIFLGSRIVRFYFKDLAPLYVINLFLGLRDGHGAKEAHTVQLGIMSQILIRSQNLLIPRLLLLGCSFFKIALKKNPFYSIRIFLRAVSTDLKAITIYKYEIG
jgi:hypothetical protein